MRKVLKFVKGRRDDKKDHGSSSRALGPFSDLPSPVDQITPTDEHGPGFENAFGYHVDLNGKDKTLTKLHKAAWQGNLEKLKVNMKKIDIDVIDRNNRTPLHLAAAQGHANIVWFLLGNKANMNICDKEGKTPFLKAIECGHKETIQIMLERGVDINTIDYSGNSGLHIAAKHGYYEIASMLLKQGANFESSNNFGEFPLHIATVAENKDLVELLLRYGSSVNIVDRDNRSPLMFAAKLGSMALVQLFLEYGAQRAVMDSNDWTAEDYALMGGHQDVAAELKSPSERMVMSYTDKSADTPGHAISIVTAEKRSISDASLPPEPQEGEKEDTTGASKHSEDADNSDTWNDSQLSDSSLKQKGGGLKLSKFLPPSSDDEISEESIQSPRVQEMKDEEIQDSPRSCVIPPPCKPPRSWDLIQSGVIDDPKVLEPRRRSLLPLGSLRSRRESFNESPSGAESSSFHDDSPHQGQGDADQWLGSQSFRKSDDKRDSLTRRHLNLSENEGSKDSPSTKYEDIQFKSILGKDNSTRQQKEKKNGSTIGGGGDAATLSDVKGKESLKGSSSESDWDSDDSLPLDNYPPVANVTISPADDTNSPLKVFRVVKPNELDVPENADGFREGSPYSLNSEKRGRFLMRAPSIDLTDDDTETGKNKHSHSSASSDLAKLTSENKDGSESDKNHSVAGTLGRDGTLRGYEEVWEVNAHLPATNIVLTGVPAGIGDTHITIKEELEESLVWSSPQFDGNKAVPPRPVSGKEGPEKLSSNEDNLLYPSPRFDQKSKSEEFSDSSVSIEGTRKQMSLDEYNRRNSGLKLESRSLDALEPQKYVVDPKLPRTRKHSRQQSISIQSWSKSEELHEKPTSSAHFERMIEENKRINAQLRCYDEALRDLAHVSIVRKQSSLSLPRAKEVSGLPRSQSAGGRNEGYFSLPSASNFAPREMATSAIVKKQGSLSLPRTSEIPDFAMMHSLGPKKQGHSSLPSTNEFGIREMAQTAIVKRQGSLSLPRTCEIPDLAAVANEEYLSLPRSNELIDEAFKEIGQSTATMKRGSRSLPRSIDAKSISLGADPIAPPRHKKTHRRRRAESEGETSSSSLKDPVRSLSLDIKRQTPKGSESSSPNVKSPENQKSDVAIDKFETPSVESTSSNGSSKEISLEKPIRKKRKMLLAMRGFLGTNRKNVNDSTVNEASVEESFDEPPFWMSTDKGGPLERQATVIERPYFSSGTKEASPSRLEAVQSEEKEEPQQESQSKDQSSVTDGTMPSNSLQEEAAAHEETISPEERDVVDEILPEPLHKESPDIQRDSQSDDAESGLSHSDNTPQHVYILKGHHNLLKEHLQKATAEKSRLEETAAELGERAEKLKYELAEAKEATRSRDEVIALLEEQLTRLEEKYTESLEEAQRYKLRLGNLEQELKHLKDMCIKNEDEKVRLTEIIRLKEMELLNLDKTVTAKDEEQKLQTMLGEKEIEQKKQEMEIHVNYLQVEKSKLTEEVNKVERKNEDLRQKLDAVVARNQLLSEEKAALCAKNSLSIKTLQEHSERWKLLYETCMDKLKLLSSAKKSVDQETQISNGTQVDKEDFKQEVQDIIHRIEEAKEKDYAIWQNKIQEDVLNAVQLLNAEYSRIESSLLKHNEKLELVIQKLLENLITSPTKQLFIEGSGNETGTAAEALKLVEELTQLNSDLKIQYQQLKLQLDKRHEELRKKSEIMKPLDVGSGEASKIEQDLRKENELLKEQLMHALNESPDKSRELWQELKAENIRLQEQLNLLVEHIKELEQTGEKEDVSESEKQAKSLNRDEKSGHQDKTEDCRDSEKDSVNEMDDDFDHGQDDILDDIEDVEKQERSPYYARELFDELKNENLQLQKQLDLLVEQIREKEDFVDKETSTDKESEYEELHVQNSELKTKIANLEDRMKKDMQEQQVMTDPVVWEPSQEYSEILKSLNIENEKLKNKIHSIEENVNNKFAMQDKGTMTEDQIKHEERKYKEENARLKKHISVLQNKIRQLKLDDMGEGEFGPLYEEEEYEGAGCVLDKSPPNEVLRTSPTTRPKSNYKNRFTQFQLEYAQEQLERMEEQRTAVLYENKKLQERLNEQAKTRDMETVEKLVSEKEELEKQLTSLRSLLEKDEATVHVSVQTMTEPDMEVVHLSMENAALQSQLKQLSKKYETKQDELEKTALLLREAREASTLLLQESRNATLHENVLLKKELDDVRQLLRSQEQNRNEPQREIQPPKVAELCNLLDHLRKENTDLQFQLKKMLSEKDKDEVDDCDGEQVGETVSKDCLVDEKAANKNLELALLLSMGTQIKSEEIIDIAKNVQTPYIRLEENNSAVAMIDNRHENGFAQAQHIAASEFRNQNSVNTKMKEHDILTVEFSKAHHRKYSGPYTESKDCELGCTPVAVRQQITGPNPSISSTKIQSSFKDSYSSSSETCSEMKNFQHQSMGGGSFESANSEMGNEPINRLGFRSSRDAATNTTPSAQNVELQRELQMEKERCRKYQQNVKKLKSDVQLLKGKLGDSKKPGKTDSNLALKQNNANNNSLLPNVPSPSQYDHNMADFQRQVTELEQKVRDENSMRFSLEVQVNKMRYELQEKFQLEKELTVLRNRLEKDFVSRYELEQLRNSYEVALSRAKYEAEMAARDDLNEKLCQINSFIEKQVQEQTRLSQVRNTTESQLKQDFQETRLTLLSELAKVQASLQAKGEEEKELREKCDKLTRECEKKQEIRRKKLIEKSYNVNLAPNSNLKEKEMNSKGYMLDIRSPLHSTPASVQPVINPISSSSVPVTDSWPTDHPFSHILRRELERSIRKHTRTDSLTEHPSSSGSAQTTASDEHLERLKKKYFLH